MTGALAFLGPFGDAVDFVLHEREGPGGAQVEVRRADLIERVDRRPDRRRLSRRS